MAAYCDKSLVSCPDCGREIEAIDDGYYSVVDGAHSGEQSAECVCGFKKTRTYREAYRPSPYDLFGQTAAVLDPLTLFGRAIKQAAESWPLFYKVQRITRTGNGPAADIVRRIRKDHKSGGFALVRATLKWFAGESPFFGYVFDAAIAAVRVLEEKESTQTLSDRDWFEWGVSVCGNAT